MNRHSIQELARAAAEQAETRRRPTTETTPSILAASQPPLTPPALSPEQQEHDRLLAMTPLGRQALATLSAAGGARSTATSPPRRDASTGRYTPAPTPEEEAQAEHDRLLAMTHLGRVVLRARRQQAAAPRTS